MARFRKKPVVIEAVQWNGTLGCLTFLEGLEGTHSVIVAGDKLRIPTLEGVMTASLGDWIIKGVNGELYPCKPDIFAQTYEAV